jgi:anti-sigma regulatory factor (Ser/Thr protein kinase)
MPSNPPYAADQQSFDATFPARVEALPTQRHDFATWLDAIGIDAGFVEDLTVVFSELTTNAVHGSPGPQAPVTVAARCEDEHLRLDIRNVTSSGGQDVRRWNLDDPLREGGRGLLIVRALVDHLDIRQDGRDLAVSCRCRVVEDGGDA